MKGITGSSSVGKISPHKRVCRSLLGHRTSARSYCSTTHSVIASASSRMRFRRVDQTTAVPPSRDCYETCLMIQKPGLLLSPVPKCEGPGAPSARFGVVLRSGPPAAVPIADNKIAFKITGAGSLIGVGNGDPNSQESDKAPVRSLWKGLAQVILQSTKAPGTIEIEATKDPKSDGPNLPPARLTITTKKVDLRPSVS